MKNYIKPEFESIKFEVEDVITTSWTGGNNELPPVDLFSVGDESFKVDDSINLAE